MPVWPLPTWRHCTAGSRLPPDHACDVADPRALAALTQVDWIFWPPTPTLPARDQCGQFSFGVRIEACLPIQCRDRSHLHRRHSHAGHPVLRRPDTKAIRNVRVSDAHSGIAAPTG
jgi:hypothetical protein